MKANEVRVTIEDGLGSTSRVETHLGYALMETLRGHERLIADGSILRVLAVAVVEYGKTVDLKDDIFGEQIVGAAQHYIRSTDNLKAHASQRRP